MSGGGSKRGERRGGRVAGTPNRKTVERDLIAKRERENGGRDQDDTSPTPIKDTSTLPMLATAEAADRVNPLGREVLNTFMRIYMGRAAFFQPRPQLGEDGRVVRDTNPNSNEGLFNQYAARAVETAAKLAPYQSPQYRAIFVAPPPTANGGVGKKRYTLTVVDNSNGRTINAEIDRPGEDDGSA